MRGVRFGLLWETFVGSLDSRISITFPHFGELPFVERIEDSKENRRWLITVAVLSSIPLEVSFGLVVTLYHVVTGQLKTLCFTADDIGES